MRRKFFFFPWVYFFPLAKVFFSGFFSFSRVPSYSESRFFFTNLVVGKEYRPPLMKAAFIPPSLLFCSLLLGDPRVPGVMTCFSLFFWLFFFAGLCLLEAGTVFRTPFSPPRAAPPDFWCPPFTPPHLSSFPSPVTLAGPGDLFPKLFLFFGRVFGFICPCSAGFPLASLSF